jgi:opacity protein-like surface antigen
VNGVRTNNSYNNGYAHGDYNGQIRTFEGVVVVDNGTTNTFVLRTNNGARIRVTAPSSQMRGLSLGDVVRVEGRVQGANLFTNNVSIIDNN